MNDPFGSVDDETPVGATPKPLEGHDRPIRRRSYDTAPLVVAWETTQACGLTCDHCRADASPDRHPGELSTAEAVSLFEAVARFDPHPFLVLSGGDPLERPDCFELLAAAVEAGLTPAITPATTSRLDANVIERFADIGVGRMAVSIDGASAARHDAFRGEPGTFDIAIDAMRHARSVGLTTQVNTTVTAATVDQLPAIADRVESLDAAVWEVFFLVPVGRGSTLSQLTPSRTLQVMEWMTRRARSAPFKVITVEAPFYRRIARESGREMGHGSGSVGSTGAGNGFVFVSHTGDVYPSGFLPIPVGNVRETPLPRIYREADLLQRLRDPDDRRGPCGRCPARRSCGGSRSRAFGAAGDPLASDPLCPWVDSATQNR